MIYVEEVEILGKGHQLNMQ